MAIQNGRQPGILSRLPGHLMLFIGVLSLGIAIAYPVLTTAVPLPLFVLATYGVFSAGLGIAAIRRS